MWKSLKSKSFKGIKWSSINTAYNAILTPLFFGVLAILLTPYEYAYIAVIMLVYRISVPLVKFGIEEAYVQDNEVTYIQTSSMFYFNIVISIIVSLVILAVSSLLEKYYGLVNLSMFINLLIPVVLIEGGESVFKASLVKQFFLKERAIILIIRMTVRVISTVFLVLIGIGPISIVLGLILATVSTTILFVITSVTKTNLRVKFNFELRAIFAHLRFGCPIMGKKFFEIFSQRIDEIIIGTIMSPTELGIYFFGKNLIMQIRTAITKSFSMVLLPLYSKFNNSLDRLKDTYFLINKFASIITFPALIGIALTSSQFVPLIFGDQWIDSILVIQVLSFSIILPIIVGNNATSLLYSLGHSFVVLKIEVISTVLYITSLIFAKGFISILICFSTYLLINTITLQYIVNKNISSKFKSYVQNIKPVLLASVVMIISVVAVNKNLINQDETMVFILSVIVGVITYTFSLFIFDRKSAIKLLKMLIRKNAGE